MNTSSYLDSLNGRRDRRRRPGTDSVPQARETFDTYFVYVGDVCSAHRDPEADQGISTVCGYPEGVGLMALDVLSCELDGHAEGSHHTARIRGQDNNELCCLGCIVVLPGQRTQLLGEQFKVVLRHVTKGRARSHSQLGCDRR
jgi:hypothetical protein